ncbi:MAG: proliferating cell nuclear antigen (pcna) [Promethearchaeia archaeon]
MFNIKLENPKILKTIISAIEGLIDETVIRIALDKVVINAMDPSKIVLTEITLPEETFDDYNVTEPANVPLNLEDLNKILKRVNNSDFLRLSMTENAQKIKISAFDPEHQRNREFHLALLDLDIEKADMTTLFDIHYPATATLSPGLFLEALKDCEIYSEIINISATEETLYFKSEGQIGEANYELFGEYLSNLNVTSDAKGTYAIEHLKKILKLIAITEKFSIDVKTDHPINLTFDISTGGTVHYFQAPRVEEPEFDEEEILEDLELEEEEAE